jgi:hypothetical protein
MNNPTQNQHKLEEKSRLDYTRAQTKTIKYSLGLVVRAELHRRGMCVSELCELLRRGYGYTGNHRLLHSTLYGNAWSRSINLILLSGYILGITFSLEDINKAKAYLIGIGRSVKNI